jgi:hypothetical protein
VAAAEAAAEAARGGDAELNIVCIGSDKLINSTNPSGT